MSAKQMMTDEMLSKILKAMWICDDVGRVSEISDDLVSLMQMGRLTEEQITVVEGMFKELQKKQCVCGMTKQ